MRQFEYKNLYEDGVIDTEMDIDRCVDNLEKNVSKYIG